MFPGDGMLLQIEVPRPIQLPVLWKVILLEQQSVSSCYKKRDQAYAKEEESNVLSQNGTTHSSRLVSPSFTKRKEKEKLIQILGIRYKFGYLRRRLAQAGVKEAQFRKE